MSTLATLVVALTADAGKFEKDMDAAVKKSEGFSAKLGKAFSTVGKLAAGAAVGGIAALGAGLAFATKEAMEAQEVQAQLNAVLESTGGVAGVTADMANGLADKYSKITRFGDEAILSGENLLLTFTNIGSDVFPQATETMLNMSQALGTDLQSSATMLGKALQDPIMGVSALRRVGVNFSADQQEVIKNLVETGHAAEAQALILQELQTEFGGSAEAAGQTLGGQLDILKTSLSNVAESVGTALIPALTGFVTTGILPFVQEYGPILAAWLAEMLPIAIQTLSDFWTNVLQPAITTVWSWMSTVLIPFLQGTVFPWLQVNIPAALQTLSNFWTNVLKPAITTVWNWMSTVLIPFLVNTVFPWLQKNIPAALQTLSNFWTNVLKPAITTVWNWMSTVLIPFLVNTVFPWLQEKIPAALQTLSDFWTNVLKPAIEAVWAFIQDPLVPLFTALWDLLSVAGKVALEVLAGIWENVLKPALDTVWGFIQDNILPIFETLWSWLSEKLGPAADTLSTGPLAIMKGVFEGVRDAVQWVIDKIGILTSTLSNVTLPDWLQRHSPSPFEMTFIGAAAAIDELSRYSLPRLSMALNTVPSASTTNNYNLVIHTNSRSERIVDDFNSMRVWART